MSRQAWKIYWRLLRIMRRESLKAATDAMAFGTGYVFVSNDGFINHIRPEAVVLPNGRTAGIQQAERFSDGFALGSTSDLFA